METLSLQSRSSKPSPFVREGLSLTLEGSPLTAFEGTFLWSRGEEARDDGVYSRRLAIAGYPQM